MRRSDWRNVIRHGTPSRPWVGCRVTPSANPTYDLRYSRGYATYDLRYSRGCAETAARSGSEVACPIVKSFLPQTSRPRASQIGRSEKFERYPENCISRSRRNHDVVGMYRIATPARRRPEVFGAEPWMR